MDYQVNMNGIDVNAHYSKKEIDELFLPLLSKLTDLQKEKDRRILVFLAAPPGAGKSTLASFLQMLSEHSETLTDIQAIGMDGFHRRQEYLLTHTTVRDGKEIKMVEIKGAPITFDLDAFRKRIEKILRDESVSWPVYDRHLHNPVEGAVTVQKEIVLLEGNYLLLDEDGWRDLKALADLSIFIKADEDMLKGRLIDRKAKSGNSFEEAEKFVDFSDMSNLRLCLHNSLRSDILFWLDREGEYHEEVLDKQTL